jgi:protein SCO1/2
MKNKSYIGISFIVLVFGIWVVKEIKARYFMNNELVEIGSVPSFSFTNQDLKKVSDIDMKGKVYLVEFFFATCPTICPKMNRNMLKIEKDFINNPNFGIISITINPEHDTAAFLKEHKEHLGRLIEKLAPNRWKIREYLMFDLIKLFYDLYDDMEDE